MDSFQADEELPENLSISELIKQLREARNDRDQWHTKARLSSNQLQRILRSPSWKITKPFRIINLIVWKFNPQLHDKFDDLWKMNNSGPTVWQMIGNQVNLETSNADLESRRIAVLAHWSDSSQVSSSLNALIDELLDNSYEIVLVSACESPKELQFENGQEKKITILRKPNYGYDFGSWSVAFSFFPKIFEASEVLVLNDSCAGPFSSMRHLLQEMSKSPYHITGVTDSAQIRYHIQSYMMHFKNGSLDNEAMRKFWSEIYSQDDKKAVIQAYEIGLTSVAQSNGMYVGAIFPWNLVTDYWMNPSIHGAKRLLELGFPFLKREFIRRSSKKELIQIRNSIVNRFKISAEKTQKLLS